MKDGTYNVKMDQVEKGSNAIRTVISQFREYKRRRGTVPTCYQAPLQPLNDASSTEKLDDLDTSERAVGEEEKQDGSMASEEGCDAKSSGSEDLQAVPVSAPVEETIFVASGTSIESDDSYGLFCDGSVVETAPAVATPSPSVLVVLPTTDDLLFGVPTSGIQPAKWAKLNKEIKSEEANPEVVLKRPVGAVVDEQTVQTKTRTTKQGMHNKTKKIPRPAIRMSPCMY